MNKTEMEDLYIPPFDSTYRSLLDSCKRPIGNSSKAAAVIEERELPLVDLHRLDVREMARASSEWGFFQLVNHGIPSRLIARMRSEQENIFRRPFEKKANEVLPGFSADSYRWGVPSATSIEQLSWSEAYHLPLTLSTSHHESNSLRSTIEEFAEALSALAQKLALLLSQHIGYEGSYFEKSCTRNTCYLRLNRYPPCPISAQMNGLIPHTDSDFLTILWQDQVGGLQVMKDGSWIAVKPRSDDALVVNIGDLFEVWSNGIYKSVEHRVVANRERERFSLAYFLCPSYHTVIESCRGDAPLYRKFTFKEYREKVQEDVKLRGYKIGLPRFLLA